MLDRLQAEESLLEMTRVAMGSGTLQKDAERRIRAQWQRAAGPKRERPKPTEAQFAIQVTHMGIRFEKEE